MRILVRRTMYSGAILLFIGGPLLLGSSTDIERLDCVDISLLPSEA